MGRRLAAWGGVHTLTGGSTLNARLPGQWFQTESGLHYNWHRHYDPTTGRYTQPDPLGFVDGPSVYSYARGNPQRFVDRNGRNTRAAAIGGNIGHGLGFGTPIPGGAYIGRCIGFVVGYSIGYGISRGFEYFNTAKDEPADQPDEEAENDDKVKLGDIKKTDAKT